MERWKDGKMESYYTEWNGVDKMGFFDWLKKFGDTGDQIQQRRANREQIRQTELQREILGELRRRPRCNSMPEFLKCENCEQRDFCEAGSDYYFRRWQEGWRVVFGGPPPSDEELRLTHKKMVRDRQEYVDKLVKEGRNFFDRELSAAKDNLKNMKNFDSAATRIAVLAAWETALEDKEDPYSACENFVTWHPLYRDCGKCMKKDCKMKR